MEKTIGASAQIFFDTANDLLCRTKDFTVFNFVSEKWSPALGWQLTELNEKNLIELVHPEDLEKTLNIFDVARSRTSIYSFENRLVTKDKEIRFLEWRITFEAQEAESFICIARDITELRQKDHQLKLTQSLGTLGTWNYHLKKGKFSCSEEFYRIHDLDPSEELTTARHASFYDEDNWIKANAVFSNCLEHGVPWNIELLITTEKGIPKWTQSRGFPMYLGNEIIGVEGIILDLTPRKNEELILKQTVEELGKLHLSIDQHCLVARLNPYGYCMDVNRVFEKNSGYELPEFIGKPFSELMFETTAQPQLQEILALLGRGEKWRDELRLRNKNGGFFWVDMSMTPIMDQSNRTLHEIVCIGYDITEKKLNDERYKTVISGINAGIWDWPDVTKNNVYWSPQFYEILEYDPANTPSTAEFFFGLIHPDELPGFQEKFKASMEKDSSYLFEFRMLCGSGKYKWVQNLGIILRDEQGQPYRVLGSITDINQKKLFEFYLEEEKQKTIQHSKLATLGEMAAGLAHEVNNPLTIIFGYIRILEEEIISREANYELMHKHVGLIKNAAQRAAKIVTNLKDFSREGSNDPFVEIPASQLVSMVLDLCNERFKTNGIRIDLEILNDPVIYCRKIELSQVLLNLLFNSYDAIEGDKDKWVKLVVFERPRYMELSLTDSGKGLPTEISEKVFTPFFTTKKVGKGTGIGLSISQRIILNHGGEIFYDISSPNTKFVIRLPFNENL